MLYFQDDIVMRRSLEWIDFFASDGKIEVKLQPTLSVQPVYQSTRKLLMTRFGKKFPSVGSDVHSPWIFKKCYLEVFGAFYILVFSSD